MSIREKLSDVFLELGIQPENVSRDDMVLSFYVLDREEGERYPVDFDLSWKMDQEEMFVVE